MLWKRVLFLNDNHIRWLVHAHKRIFLPAANALLADVQSTVRDTLQAYSMLLQTTSSRLVVWNLLGRTRTGKVDAEVDLPDCYNGLGLRSSDEERVPIHLEDNRSGKVMQGGNRLLNLVPRPTQDEYAVRGDVPLRD